MMYSYIETVMSNVTFSTAVDLVINKPCNNSYRYFIRRDSWDKFDVITIESIDTVLGKVKYVMVRGDLGTSKPPVIDPDIDYLDIIANDWEVIKVAVYKGSNSSPKASCTCSDKSECCCNKESNKFDDSIEEILKKYCSNEEIKNKSFNFDINDSFYNDVKLNTNNKKVNKGDSMNNVKEKYTTNSNEKSNCTSKLNKDNRDYTRNFKDIRVKQYDNVEELYGDLIDYIYADFWKK